MTKQYDVIVYIGRFQPVHNAHVKTIERAMDLANQVLVIVGSANQPRTVKNPFTVGERHGMIDQALQPWHRGRLLLGAVEDNLYNDQVWAADVQRVVDNLLGVRVEGTKIALIGHSKDDSSFYLKMFPQWEFIEQEKIEPLNATAIRDMYFEPDVNFNFFKGVLAPNTIEWLKLFKETVPAYWVLAEEKQYIDDYKRQYAAFPYPPIFVTVDAVVIQSGHVLMVKRKAQPGKGLWALPGGFVNAYTDKSIEDAMLRELDEETKIKLPQKVLRGNIRASKVFDAVGRSARGRTITHAFNIVLPDGEWNLPKVKGCDDAEVAKWIPIGQLDRSTIFEDHAEIISYFLGKL